MTAEPFLCRPACGACCIVPSISTPILQPDGSAPRPKPAHTPCPQLDSDLRCRLFGLPERPAVCVSLSPSLEMCGACRDDALNYLSHLERLTGNG
jgi:uncharacterized protein